MKKSKIVSEKKILDNICIREGRHSDMANGHTFSHRNSEGRSDSNGSGLGNGYSGISGRGLGQGMGNGYIVRNASGNVNGKGQSHDFRTESIDPAEMCDYILFYSKERSSYLSWDQVWKECNEEQKMHLLLFLPLRSSDGCI